MKEVIRYGIVGIGGMGANHANLFLQNKIKNGSLEAINGLPFNELKETINEHL